MLEFLKVHYKKNSYFIYSQTLSEGNQKFWKENKIKFWKETKKIGIEILTPLGHCSHSIFVFT